MDMENNPLRTGHNDQDSRPSDLSMPRRRERIARPALTPKPAGRGEAAANSVRAIVIDAYLTRCREADQMLTVSFSRGMQWG